MTNPGPYDLFMSAFNDVEDYLKSVVYAGKDVGDVGFMKTLDAFRTQVVSHRRCKSTDVGSPSWAG